VLHDIDLSIAPGEHLCLLGENGAGKSTLLRLCAGLVRPSAGQVLLGDTPVSALRRPQIARRMAYLPQDSPQLFSFSSLEVVLMGRYIHATSAFEAPADLAAAEQALSATDCLHLRDRPYNRLSGGERRRVALSRALCQDTELLLLDEPTAGLDPAHALSLCRLLAESAKNRALLWSTHDLNLAARFAPRSAVLAGGKLALLGPTAEVLLQAGPLFGVSLHLGTLPSGVPFAVPA
jgi:iron complex transport system ATP-binding protein